MNKVPGRAELLKLFAYDLSDAQLLEIKALLANYFAEKASDRMDALWEERGWTPETMEAWGKEHLRKPANGLPQQAATQ
ncbi:MAG: hypothetical protein IPH16_10450 [Haliscomenobacter sp.]|nr:hypothetical protein [Haliscomenobacter sp.]MBK7474845.1 hypothetical protein [Haliscomenobacter sp.]MBK8877504.1 hypothetical protein [Haliscomenobacter sp.]